MFPHANRQWTWHRFLGLGLSADRDIGLLLRGLCVVDVDCLAISAELCSRYPILLRTAHETTRKGMHFFFRRSKMADAHGYYDGAAQKLACVDFKTVCSNGTSGFLVVAPSENKRWVIAPWDLTELPEIPDDLLQAVAHPKHRAVTATVRMMQTGEVLEYEESVALGRLAYTEMFEEVSEIPVPMGDAETMSALIHAMDSGRVTPAQSEEFVTEVLRLGDFLGLRVDDLRAIETRTWESMRLWSAYPEAAHVVECMDGGPLVDIAAVASTLCFHDMEFGTDAVLPSRVLNMRQGDEVIFPDFLDFLEGSLPESVQGLMSRFQSRLIVAGGFVTGEVTSCYGGGNDIDLFVTGCAADEANGIVEAFLVHDRVRPVFRTANAITFYVDEEGDNPDTIPVQIVLTLYEDPSAVLHGFDLDPCRVCAYYEGSQLRVFATPSWIMSVTTASYPVRSERWTMSSTARIIKYSVKGFQAYVPGLDRARVPVATSAMLDFIIAMQTCGGVQELVRAERAFFWQHTGTARLTYSNVGGLMSFIRASRRHDYDVTGLCGKVLQTLRYLYRKGAPLFGFGSSRGHRFGHVRLEADNVASLLTWKAPLAGTGLNAYFPVAARLEEVVSAPVTPA
jgi:hypothetical protein